MPHHADSINSMLEGLPDSLAAEIYSQYKAVQGWFNLSHHTFPRPIWSEKGFSDTGQEAWLYLSKYLAGQTPDHPLSIYFHIPFCQNRCGFCDMLSTPMPKHKLFLQEEFAEILCKEMALWASLSGLVRQPVTTVHFGGGTPGFIQDQYLNKIVATCCNYFNISHDTELAIESTARLLSDDHISRLLHLGFTRLHVGVQSLNDSIRKKIGRREPGNVVVEKLNNAIKQGLIVSVDILYGLPGLSQQDLISTLMRLIEIGVHGFSLYQLQRSPRNDTFLRKIGIRENDHEYNYVCYQLAEYFLRRAGYTKNFFTHFALPEDKCLYYHHIKRGENLLAFGPTADGIFDHYHYRHTDLKDYMKNPLPALEGGINDSETGQTLRVMKASLMTAHVNKQMFTDLKCEPLLDLWLACRLLAKTANHDEYELTGNGSWLITQMLEQLHNRMIFLS
jgi:coproporphyrinogen III oxidase-like Fe-S oxidoreductase